MDPKSAIIVYTYSIDLQILPWLYTLLRTILLKSDEVCIHGQSKQQSSGSSYITHSLPLILIFVVLTG